METMTKKILFLCLIIFITINVAFECGASGIFEKIAEFMFVKKRTIKTICFPKWINNGEYCYLEVYYKGKKVMEAEEGRYAVFDLRGDADFYIYKSTLSRPREKQLIKKLTVNNTTPISSTDFLQTRLAFKFSKETNKITFCVVQVDEIGIALEYLYYIMDVDGNNMKTFNIDGFKMIHDVSPDGKSVVYPTARAGIGRLTAKNVLKDINTEIYTQDHRETDKLISWLSENKIFLYRSIISKFVEGKEREYKYNLLLLNPQDKTTQIIHTEKLPKIKGAAISPDEKIILLGNVGILQEVEDSRWKIAGEFNLSFPDFSPDGKRVIGLNKDGKIKIIETTELLR